MSRRLVYAVGVATILALAACASGSSDGGSSDGGPADPGSDSPTTSAASEVSAESLEGNTYVSTAVTGRDLAADSAIELTFSDGQLTVVAGCNTIGSTYEIDDGTLSFTGEPRSTMMACSEDLTAQDQWLITWLTDGVGITASALGLSLSGDGVTIDVAQGGAPVESVLVGPVWTLASTSQDDEAVTVPPSVQAPTLEFAGDGGVAVFAGCNSGSTSATTTGDTITFMPVPLTEMACEEPTMALEATVAAVLDGDVAYVLDGNQLTLSKGTISLIYSGS